jgi:hypothetical protein
MWENHYVWLIVPEQFQGSKFTRQNAGGKPLEEINIYAKKDTTFYLLTSRHAAYNHLKTDSFRNPLFRYQ